MRKLASVAIGTICLSALVVMVAILLMALASLALFMWAAFTGAPAEFTDMCFLGAIVAIIGTIASVLYYAIEMW